MILVFSGSQFAHFGRVVGVTGSRALTVISGALNVFLIAAILGPSEFGTYALCLGVGQVMAQLGKWGVDGLAVRHVPRLVSSNAAALLPLIVINERRILARSAVIFLIAIAVRYAAEWLHLSCATTDVAPFAALVTIPTSMSFFYQGALRGLNRQSVAELPEGTAKPLLIAAIVGASYLLASSVVSFRVVYCALLFVSIGIALGCGLLVRMLVKAKCSATVNDGEFDPAPWFAEAKRHGLMNFSQMLLARLPVLVAGVALSTSEVGFLSISLRISELVQFVTTSIGLAISPTVSLLHRDNKWQELRKLFFRSSALAFASAVVISVLLALLAPYVLGTMGDAYAEVFSLTIILLVTQVIAAGLGQSGYFISMMGRQMSSAVLNLVLILPLGGALFLLGVAHQLFWYVLVVGMGPVISNVILVRAVYCVYREGNRLTAVAP